MKLSMKICMKCYEKRDMDIVWFHNDWLYERVCCVGYIGYNISHREEIMDDVEDYRRNQCPYLLEHMLENGKTKLKKRKKGIAWGKR